MESSRTSITTRADQPRAGALAAAAPEAAGPGAAPELSAVSAAPRRGPSGAVSRFQSAAPAQRARLMRQIQRAGGNSQAAHLVAQARGGPRPAPAPAAAPIVRQAAPATPAPVLRRSWLSAAGSFVSKGLKAAGSLVSEGLDAASKFAGKKLRNKVAGFAMGLPFYGLLRLALGRDPISGEAVARSPKNVLRGLLGLVPVVGERLFQAMDEAGAIDTAFAWADGKLKQIGLNYDLIKSTFTQAWAALSLKDAILDPGGTWARLKGIFLGPINTIRAFGGAAIEQAKRFIFAAVIRRLGGGPVLGMLQAAGSALISDPIGFLRNLIKGLGQGFKQFGANILTYLQRGLFSWLFGEVAKAGLQLPRSFDLPGILQLVMQLLGLSWEFLRGRAVKVLGEPVVAMAEKGFKAFVLIRERGLAGLWEEVKEQLGGLRGMVFEAVRELVTSQVIQAGIQWLLSMLGGPAGALVKAITAIYDIVVWFTNNARQLAALIGAVARSIGAIAAGSVGQAAGFVERALGGSIPVLIGFLANLLGLGGLSQKIRGAIEKLQAPVRKATGFVLGKLKAWAGRAMGKVRGVFGGGKPDQLAQGKPMTLPFSMAGARHKLTVLPGPGAKVLMASIEQPLSIKLKRAITNLEKQLHEVDHGPQRLADLKQLLMIAQATEQAAKDPAQAARAQAYAEDLKAEIANYGQMYGVKDVEDVKPFPAPRVGGYAELAAYASREPALPDSKKREAHHAPPVVFAISIAEALEEGTQIAGLRPNIRRTFQDAAANLRGVLGAHGKELPAILIHEITHRTGTAAIHKVGIRPELMKLLDELEIDHRHTPTGSAGKVSVKPGRSGFERARGYIMTQEAGGGMAKEIAFRDRAPAVIEKLFFANAHVALGAVNIAVRKSPRDGPADKREEALKQLEDLANSRWSYLLAPIFRK